MIEWVISSSVLIIMLIVIRQLFRKTLSMRVRYALWLAVALRLLIPVSFFESSLSILNLWGQMIVSEDTNAAEGQDINFLYRDNLYASHGERSEDIVFRNGLNQMSAMEGTEILKLQGDNGVAVIVCRTVWVWAAMKCQKVQGLWRAAAWNYRKQRGRTVQNCRVVWEIAA